MVYSLTWTTLGRLKFSKIYNAWGLRQFLWPVEFFRREFFVRVSVSFVFIVGITYLGLGYINTHFDFAVMLSKRYGLTCCLKQQLMHFIIHKTYHKNVRSRCGAGNAHFISIRQTSLPVDFRYFANFVNCLWYKILSSICGRSLVTVGWKMKKF